MSEMKPPSTVSASAWREPRAKIDGLSMMAHLYNRLDGYYPNLWRANFKGEAAIANWEIAWAESFEEERISPVEVAIGLKACRRMYEMPPSLTQFLKACRPVVGLESLFHRAVAEMQRRRSGEPQTWPDGRLFWAAAQLGNDLLAHSYRDLAGRWQTAYELAAGMANDPVPDVDPNSALPAPGKTHISREEAAARCETLKIAVGKGKGKATPNQIAKWKANLADPKCSLAVHQMSREILIGLGEIQPEQDAAA